MCGLKVELLCESQKEQLRWGPTAKLWERRRALRPGAAEVTAEGVLEKVPHKGNTINKGANSAAAAPAQLAGVRRPRAESPPLAWEDVRLDTVEGLKETSVFLEDKEYDAEKGLGNFTVDAENLTQ